MLIQVGRIGHWSGEPDIGLGGSGEKPRDSGESGLICGHANQLPDGEICILIPVRIMPGSLQYKRYEECCRLDMHIKVQQS